MRIEFDAAGNVLNTYDVGTVGEWYPDDTRIRAETEQGEPRPWGALRISRHQAPDWPHRAARAWNETTRTWEPTGGEPQESDLERAIRLLKNNPVPELPESPTTADVVAQVRLHQQYLEGYRKIILRLLAFIGRRIHRD